MLGASVTSGLSIQPALPNHAAVVHLDSVLFCFAVCFV